VLQEHTPDPGLIQIVSFVVFALQELTLELEQPDVQIALMDTPPLLEAQTALSASLVGI
jgi:hypothetical protein